MTQQDNSPQASATDAQPAQAIKPATPIQVDQRVGQAAEGATVVGVQIGNVAGDVITEQHGYAAAQLRTILVAVIIAVALVAGGLVWLASGGLSAFVAARPGRMPGNFNVAIVEFGQLGPDGVARKSADGKLLSESLFHAMDLELQNLPLGVRQNFSPTVWLVDFVSSYTDAQKLQNDIGADALIYGYLTGTADAAELALEYSVRPLRNEAEELLGKYRLGSPVPLRLPVEANKVQNAFALTDRQKLLSRFTVGLMHDLNGFFDRALEVYEPTLAELNSSSGREGREVLQYFIGRAYLFGAQQKLAEAEEAQAKAQPTVAALAFTQVESYTLKAEVAFTQAWNLNPDYARTHIGLGSVNIFRAGRQPPTERMTQTLWLQRAFGEYEQALKIAQQTNDPFLLGLAESALSSAHFLRGEGQLYQSDWAGAAQSFDQALRFGESALPRLGQQPRLRAQTYLALGNSHFEQGIVSEQLKNTTSARARYEASIKAYDECIKIRLDERSQKFVTSRCQSYQASVKKQLAELK